MLIDTNDVIHAKEIYFKIVFKNGKEFQTTLKCEDIKSIDLNITEHEYRRSIWVDEEKELKE